MIDTIPFLGVGLGYRPELHDGIMASADSIDFLELITDHYIDMPPHKWLEAEAIAARFPVVLHSVELSIGTEGPIKRDYVQKVREVAAMTKAHWISDHLCFTGAGGLDLAQLAPLSFRVDVADRTADRTREVMTFLERPFLIENVAYYFQVAGATMSEAEFIRRVVLQSGCYLLLDLTNVQCNAFNHGYDPFLFLDQMPLDRVIQIHVAGGYPHRGLLLDAHSHAVPDEVFAMLEHIAPRLTNLKGVLLERDQDYPPIDALLVDIERVKGVLASCWAPMHRRFGETTAPWARVHNAREQMTGVARVSL
jgi:uncharacterized protein